MKKLLLVLMVVAMASFLLVGCLPGTTPDNGDGDGDGDGVVEITLEVENYYLDPLTGKTFVNGLDDCLQDVIVTIPGGIDAIETYEDSVVYVAVKWYDETTGKDVYSNLMEATSTDDIVWTAEDYNFCGILEWDEYLATPAFVAISDCESICLVALVKHPCCPGDEIALEVVTVDGADPYADLFVTVKDCADPCVEEDECVPPAGAYIEWTSRTTGDCETTDCCGDDCSGVGTWTIEVEPDPCLGPCDLVTGTGCPIEGVLDCGCFPYATGVSVGDDPNDTETYEVKFTLLDNVGNKVEGTWELEFDTDSLISFTGGTLSSGTTYQVLEGDCVEPE